MWLAVMAVAYRLASASTPTCGQPDLPPDPRCGDSLDGREAPPDPGSEAGRAALAVPHLVSQVVMWPVVETSQAMLSETTPPFTYRGDGRTDLACYLLNFLSL